MKRSLLVGGTIVFLTFAVRPVMACGGGGCYAPSPTLIPTWTPYPTWTPIPTITPYPTLTPLPTGAPETGPGDNLAVPALLAIGGLGFGIRRIAGKIW